MLPHLLTTEDDLLPKRLEPRSLVFRPHDCHRDHQGEVLLQPEV